MENYRNGKLRRGHGKLRFSLVRKRRCFPSIAREDAGMSKPKAMCSTESLETQYFALFYSPFRSL